MSSPEKVSRRRPSASTLAWLALVALTFASLGLGEWFHSASWLPLLVAAVVWIKGSLVARCFIESHRAHPFIARVLRAFIAFAPLALVATAYFGERLARWTAL
ncbi:MAG: hypothetical protein H6R10_4 [Rhodocyclaceae bacterium]|nr:hypothetical protein [Rhodocyclaceae bacterium]